MGLQLPGALAGLLGMLGYTWPEADEAKLMDLGRAWMEFSGTLQSTAARADAVARQVWTGNKGAEFEAFRADWTAGDAAAQNLRTGAGSCLAMAAGLMIAAAVVLALKIAVIVQLVLLAVQTAQAIATAGVTFGASLAQIPVFKTITGLIIDVLIDQAVGALLG